MTRPASYMRHSSARRHRKCADFMMNRIMAACIQGMSAVAILSMSPVSAPSRYCGGMTLECDHSKSRIARMFGVMCRYCRCMRC